MDEQYAPRVDSNSINPELPAATVIPSPLVHLYSVYDILGDSQLDLEAGTEPVAGIKHKSNSETDKFRKISILQQKFKPQPACSLHLNILLRRMDCDRMLEQIAETKEHLFAEGYLNDNFVILENFEKKHGSEFFVKGALTSYFERSAEILTNLEQELKKDPLDILMLHNLLFGVREHSISVGANKVLIKVNQLGQCMDSRNTQRCLDALQELKLVHEKFKNRMELYFEMMQCEPPSEIEDDPGFEDEESTDEE